MATVTAPIKVDAETDKLISHAAHFLQRSKKDVVDAAVREYVETHRELIQSGVLEALRSLDGSTKSAVSLLTGLSPSELDDLGGLDS
jgi:predicted transcriptional regulator